MDASGYLDEQHATRSVLVTATTFPSFVPGTDKPPFVFELSRRIAALTGWRMLVSTPHAKGAATHETRDGLVIHRYRYGFTALCDGGIMPNLARNKLLYFQVPFLLLFSFIDLVRLVRRHRIGTIHAHWLIPQGFLAVLYKRLFRATSLRIVCTTHGGDVFGLRSLNFLKRWTIRHLDELTAVTTAAIPELESLRRGRGPEIRIVPMGVDTALFNPDRRDPDIMQRAGRDGPMLLFVGRLVEKKGLRYLIEAMPAIAARFPGATLFVAGDGPIAPELKTQADGLGLGDAVIFLGSVPNGDLPSYFATADVFIVPSVVAADGDREGLPVTLMEAMASGCAIVASDLAGMDDLVADGETGFVVHQHSAIEIAAKILEILSSPGELDRIKENARTRARDQIDWNIIAARYASILEDQSVTVVGNMA